MDGIGDIDGLPSRAFKSRASTSSWGGSEVVRNGGPKKDGNNTERWRWAGKRTTMTN